MFRSTEGSLGVDHPVLTEQESEPGGEGVPELRWLDFDGGLTEIGHSTNPDVPLDFCFDNETPRHCVYLQPFRIANRKVTCREYLEFMADEGYTPKPQTSRDDGKLKAEQEKERKEQAIANTTAIRVLKAIGEAVPVRLMKRDLLFVLMQTFPLLGEWQSQNVSAAAWNPQRPRDRHARQAVCRFSAPCG